MDSRITSTILADLMEQAGYPEASYDLLSVAGAGKSLTHEGSGSGLLMDQIKMSISLHNTKELVIVLHDDCGAYKIDDPRVERSIQQQDIQQIFAVIKERFKDLDFAGFILQGTKTGNFNLVKIA